MTDKVSETFHVSLIAQYCEQIYHALLMSETDHRTRIDGEKFNSLLKGILQSAKNDGLSEMEIVYLIELAVVRQQTYQCAN